METLLNLAWAACSLALILLWIKTLRAPRRGGFSIPRGTQALALLTVVLLLLPVISLSDDLIAAQGVTETDCSVRRALHPCDLHPSAIPPALALPSQEFTALSLSGFARIAVVDFQAAAPSTSLSRPLDSRPPPRA